MENRKNEIRIQIITKKIELINQKYRYKITLDIENSLLPYTLRYKTKDNIIIKIIGFADLKDLYFYIRGIQDILEAF